jgi:uncharacterized protein (DUF1800 family)
MSDMLKPLAPARWDYAKAAHLLNRAGFGGSPADLERFTDAGLEKAVASLLEAGPAEDSAPSQDWAKPDPARADRLREMRQATPERRQELQREERRTQREWMMALRAWWLERMARGRRPLLEKMALFWHGHFATSMVKVRDVYLMWRQNQLFRRQGLGGWFELLEAVSTDPAMLVWLDQAQSRRQHPNENYARELMELFTLGEGHYTEGDVAEAARALTGLSLDRTRQAYVYRPLMHDPGEKVFLGRRGRLGLKDVLEEVLAQPAASRFIVVKLWSFFAGGTPAPGLVEALAEEFRATGSRFGPFLGAMFRCEEFYADSVVRSQIKSPVQLLVIAVRQLERELPPGPASAQVLRSLGQDLFAPPNVKGWDGGASWITTGTLLNRHNLAAALVLGEAAMPMGGPRAEASAERALARGANRWPPVEAARLFAPEDRAAVQKLIAALERRFIQGHLGTRSAETLRAYLQTAQTFDDHHLRQAIRLIMCTPEYQLA